MNPPRKPRFTDRDKFQRPYADAKASEQPGYLADKFALILEAQEKDEAERKAKVRGMKERRTA